jgi:hypothetical protein
MMRFNPIPLPASPLLLQPSPSRGALLKLPPLQGEGLGGDGVKGCGGDVVQELQAHPPPCLPLEGGVIKRKSLERGGN